VIECGSIGIRKGDFMDIFTELKVEFGSLYKLAMLLGIRETAVYQWRKRGIPIKHLRKVVELSEGRITREMLRPDIFAKD
jgi:DNA-binding transcriptional regulator YdaS (Cro superfamily)